MGYFHAKNEMIAANIVEVIERTQTDGRKDKVKGETKTKTNTPLPMQWMFKLIEAQLYIYASAN